MSKKSPKIEKVTTVRVEVTYLEADPSGQRAERTKMREFKNPGPAQIADAMSLLEPLANLAEPECASSSSGCKG